MARTAITPQSVDLTGAAITLEAANVAGNSARPGDHRFLWVKNGSGGSVTVTLPTPGTVEGLAIADRTVSVGAGAEKLIKVSNNYIQSDGSVYFDYSAVTSVTVAVVDA